MHIRQNGGNVKDVVNERAREVSAAIVQMEEDARQEVLKEEASRYQRHRDMRVKFPQVKFPTYEPVDFTKSYPGLFPADVFGPDGTRKPGMKTKVEMQAELHDL
jgi:hypothetical protein